MTISKTRTIQDCQEAIESTLLTLRKKGPAEVKNLPGLGIIAPEGFRPVVELYNVDGRKKRRTASADNWSPSDGEIRIYFEPTHLAEGEVSSAAALPARSIAPEA